MFYLYNLNLRLVSTGFNSSYSIYSYKRPGGDASFKKGGGGTVIDKKNKLSSPAAMGNNGHVQP